MVDKRQLVTVKEGDVIPFDGKVIDGCALVDESACSGVSTPVWVDSATGSHEVYKAGAIVSGWLTIEFCDGESKPVVEPEQQPIPVHAAPSEPPVPQVVGRKIHPVAITLLALVAAIVCALVATAFTDSEVVIIGTGATGFAATAFEAWRTLT